MGLLEAGKKFTGFHAGREEKTRFRGKTTILMYSIKFLYFINYIDSYTNICYTSGTRQR
jgi:hypothetical protein